MNNNNNLEKLQKITLQSFGAVLYKPMVSEVNFLIESIPIEFPKKIICVPDDKKSNPLTWAEICKKEYIASKSIFILIPGTHFDKYGTRHGKGGGWYDKFLAEVPKGWVRIGICRKHQLSNLRLIKKEWDQSVDWVVVQNELSWDVYNTLCNRK